MESARQQLESYESALSESRGALRDGLHTALGDQVTEVDYQGRLTQHEKVRSKDDGVLVCIGYFSFTYLRNICQAIEMDVVLLTRTPAKW